MGVKLKKFAKARKEECVACGNCVSYCPKSAIQIEKGMFAVVDTVLCVGCARCKAACPANVIQMQEDSGL